MNENKLHPINDPYHKWISDHSRHGKNNWALLFTIHRICLHGAPSLMNGCPPKESTLLNSGWNLALGSLAMRLIVKNIPSFMMIFLFKLRTCPFLSPRSAVRNWSRSFFLRTPISSGRQSNSYYFCSKGLVACLYLKNGLQN